MEKRSSESTYDDKCLIEPKKEFIYEVTITESCTNDTVFVVPKKEPNSSFDPVNDLYDENVGMVMPIKMELTLNDNIPQRHKSEGSVSAKDVNTKEYLEVEIKQECSDEGTSVDTICAMKNDTRLLNKCTQTQNTEPTKKTEQTFCSVCEKEFKYRSAYIVHMRSHTGERPFSCHLCNSTFTVKSSLTNHVRTHAGEKEYCCDLCPKRFTLKQQIVLHMRTHGAKKPYSCHLCPKKFAQKCNFTRHMRFHTGEKPYSCRLCQKKFAQNYQLTSHMDKHNGYKKYTCGLCQKKFTEKSSLKRHEKSFCLQKPSFKRQMSVYTDETPNSCKLCQKKFVKKCQLTSHMSEHTGDKNTCGTVRKKKSAKSNLNRDCAL